MSYAEASFMGLAARGGFGFGAAGFRNPAPEAWAYENDQRLIATARALADVAPAASEVELDFGSTDIGAFAEPAGALSGGFVYADMLR